jgi:hypothetical protein
MDVAQLRCASTSNHAIYQFIRDGTQVVATHAKTVWRLKLPEQKPKQVAEQVVQSRNT